MSKFDYGDAEIDVLVYAFRYALGRMSYCTATMQGIIQGNAAKLHDVDRNLIMHEIREAIANGRAGDKCDVDGWMDTYAVLEQASVTKKPD